MAVVELTMDTLDTASRVLAGKGPVQMLNMLRYRDEADYGERTDFAPGSGREVYYSRYVPAFAKAAKGEEYSVVWFGAVNAVLVALAEEVWDDIVIVEYPSFEILRKIVTSPQYLAEAAVHRRAALRDWRFLATSKMQPPG